MIRRVLVVGPAALTLAVLLLVIGVAESLLPANDFAPFTMRIETSGPESRAGVAELHYTNRSNWSLHDPDDEYIYACNDGLYGHFDAAGVFTTSGGIADAIRCPGANRWIAYGSASAMPWPKTVSGDAITYTNGNERVVFDRKTGFPLVYEAKRPDSSVGYRMVFIVLK